MVLGSAWAFGSAILIIVIWGLTGPAFHYSNTWQLIINTGTTIVTFLMVFLIQNTQNRDAKAAHLKLDEIIRALKGARNELIDLEKLADEDLTNLEKQFERVRKKAERNGNNPGGIRAERTALSERPRARGFGPANETLPGHRARDLCLTLSVYQNRKLAPYDTPAILDGDKVNLGRSAEITFVPKAVTVLVPACR